MTGRPGGCTKSKMAKSRDFLFENNSAGVDVPLLMEQMHAAVGLYIWSLGLKLDEQSREAAKLAARAGAKGVRLTLDVTATMEPIR